MTIINTCPAIHEIRRQAHFTAKTASIPLFHSFPAFSGFSRNDCIRMALQGNIIKNTPGRKNIFLFFPGFAILIDFI